jgi:hypothetical protein
MLLKFLWAGGMGCLLTMCFMIRGVLSRLKIGNINSCTAPFEPFVPFRFFLFLRWGIDPDRTTVQIGEIKFNFLLPHQPNVPVPQSIDSDNGLSAEDLEPSNSEISSPTTPPPNTIATITANKQDDTDPPPTPEKPDIPYATLIAQSLLSHPQRRRTLQEIYTWIQDHHAYFNKSKNKNWRSSIRHNLISSPAFVHYDPKPGDPKNKRGTDEWGISPEYQPLIGDLTAKEGDTDKLSTKLSKKKEKRTTPPPPKAPKTPAVKTEEKENGTTKKTKAVSTSPATAATAAAAVAAATTGEKSPRPPEDKAKINAMLQKFNAQGVNLAALVQEAAALMKKSAPAATTPGSVPAVQPSPANQVKPSTPTPASWPKSASPPVNGTPAPTDNPLLPIPMPLPYPAAKVAPLPSLTTTTIVKMEPVVSPLPTTIIKTESSVPDGNNALPPVAPLTLVPQSNSGLLRTTIPAEDKSTTGAGTEIKLAERKPVLETAASRRPPRRKKRPLEE